MLVSFVIPAYNASNTISRCLESIFSLPLSMEDFEILVIDDCSTDNTISVIQFFLLRYTNIKLVCQNENHRQGAARNIGIRMAKGICICFVDSDDAVSIDIVDAIRFASMNCLDMMAFHYVHVNSNDSVISEPEILEYNKYDFFTGIELQTKYPYWCSGPVAYVYNSNFLRQVNYPFVENVLYEDSDFVIAHLYKAQRMAYTKVCGYKIYNSDGSTTRSISFDRVSDYMLLGTRMLNIHKNIIKENDCDVAFANGVLEGACYNVTKSVKRLYKLKNIRDVMLFYERIDSFIDRTELSSDKLIHSFYWSAWTAIVLRHKYITIITLAFTQLLYKLYKIVSRISGL